MSNIYIIYIKQKSGVDKFIQNYYNIGRKIVRCLNMYRSFEITLKVDVTGENEQELDEAENEIRKLEHHAEYFLDLDDYPEVKCIYDVNVKRC